MTFARLIQPLTIWPELLIVLYLRNPLLIPYAAVSFVWMTTVVLNSFSLFVYSSLCLPFGPEKRNGMMSMVVGYDSSYSLNLFSWPFWGFL